MSRQSYDRRAAAGGRVSRRRFLAATGAALGAGLSLPVVIPAFALGADEANRLLGLPPRRAPWNVT